ncbi:hypothetical protein [Cryobacterium sp. SO1]|uniref:hypothetical protein n=1 Tax=Cryobacterium sp. SO1 TaxID=1897061 RepID=UPI001023C7D2|nr:hypothetical protein [Cryobacterium sp. SO1]RZI37443.1 hypothetical protein BJQ95_00101 [Cryobacterium sp. SO1]
MTALTPNAPLRRRWRALAASALAVLLLAPLLTFFQAPVSAQAASASFNAGNIISDAVFYNSKSMSVGQVQAFLNSKVATCRSGYTCLKDYRSDSAFKPAQAAGCAVYPGPASQSAAEIIWQVASVCGVNPQVLLVLLEKEQGLVSDTWPTARQYRSATGYACPDTADCDPSYYGLFNQLYQAAFQYKKYQATPSGRNFVAGRWNTIQWSPNGACGSSQVYIENQATAGLYNYTPYRPNSAALANMYGTGDGCSAYGNRNFFRMFSDWFGSTTGGGDFARTSDNASLYLLSGGVKYPVGSMGVYNQLAALGPVQIVSTNYLNSFATSSVQASTLVRDSTTGDVFYFQKGQRHRFPSCDMAAAYGLSCGAVTNLSPSQISKLPAGADMSNFFVVDSSTVYVRTAQGKSPITEWATVLKLNGGAVPYVAVMSPTAAAALPQLKTILRPLGLFKSVESPSVFMIDGYDQKRPVPSFGLAAEFGSTGYQTVPKKLLDAYATGSALTQVVNCAAKPYIVASGSRYELQAGSAAVGLLASDVSDTSCKQLRVGAAIPGQVFVIGAGSPVVYGIRSGTASAVPTWSALVALNGGSTPQILSLTAETLKRIPVGAPYLAPASVARTAGNPTIYLIDGADRKVAVASFATTAALGVKSWSTASDQSMAKYTATTTLTRLVTCNGANYFAAGGRLNVLAGTAATGMAATELRSGTCSVLTKTSTPLARVFVKTANESTVYVIESGTRRPISSWSKAVELNGGPSVTVLVDAKNGLSDIPVGPGI